MATLTFTVLRTRAFRLLLLTRFFATLALQAQAIIVGWQVYSLTKDVLMLGLVGLAEAVPALITALFAGYVVDTHKPRIVYRICCAAVALNTLFLLVIGGRLTSLDDHAVLICLFIGVFTSGIVRNFTRPASAALLPQIVTRAQIPAGMAWLTSTYQTAAVTGPAIAGLIYGGYGPTGAWLFPMILTLFTLGLSLAIHTTQPDHIPEKRDSAMKSIKAGWQFIWTNQIILPVMALDMVAVFFGGATAMLPAYADQVLHVGSEGLGILRAAPAFGAVLMSLYFAVKPMRYLSAAHLMATIAAFGVCMICFSVSTIFWLSVALLVVSGVLDITSVVIRWTMIQVLTPIHMVGRVTAVNSMFVTSSQEIGAFESGTAARLFGLTPSIAIGGLITVLVVGMTSIVAPKFRRTVVDTHNL